jgi:hypothetical protein
VWGLIRVGILSRSKPVAVKANVSKAIPLEKELLNEYKETRVENFRRFRPRYFSVTGNSRSGSESTRQTAGPITDEEWPQELLDNPEDLRQGLVIPSWHKWNLGDCTSFLGFFFFFFAFSASFFFSFERTAWEGMDQANSYLSYDRTWVRVLVFKNSAPGPL